MELAQAAAQRYGVRDKDISRFEKMSDVDARAYAESAATIGLQARRHLALAVSRSRRVNTRSSLGKAANELAFALFKFQVSARRDSDERIALAEAALRLAERTPTRQPRWLTSLRGYYAGRHQVQSQAAWLPAIGLERARALDLLTSLREELGLPPFVSNPPTIAVPSPTITDADLQIPLVERLSTLRVESIHFQDFRGIRGSLEIDFKAPSGEAASCVLYGDNGVGKSTIVSAVEFVCQNRISRQPVVTKTNAPEPINLAAGADSAYVVLTFNDGTQQRRDVSRHGSSIRVDHTTIDNAFRLSPMSLQRSDIIKFLNTTPTDRGRLFIEHFNAAAPMTAPDDELDSLREQLAELKMQRRGVLQQLATAAGARALPLSGQDVDRMLRLTFFEGLTQREWERQTGRRASREAVQIANSYSRMGAAIRTLNAQIKTIDKSAHLPLYQLQVRRLGTLLGDVGGPMSIALRDIAGVDWVNDVSVIFGGLSAISIELKVLLSGGRVLSPESVFSEGVQDLIAVLFFLEIAQAAAARGQARILILDDVMQSVDATIRLRLLDYVLSRFSSWQLFITVHDRLWREQLTELMRRKSHTFVEREIRQWRFETGPEMRGESYDDLSSLTLAVERGDSAMISSEAGRLLERMSDTLTWTLPVSVIRRRDDRYTLGDLWPSVRSKLQKTSIGSVVEEVDRWIQLRNLLGAHYNEWATSLSRAEADQFAEAVIRLYGSIHCDQCHHWVRGDGFQVRWSCRCGRVGFETPIAGSQARHQ